MLAALAPLEISLPILKIACDKELTKLYNNSFFEHAQLLRDKYYTDFQFNLFSVLRSDSDEVRLHSRFLAEILNPSGSHGFSNVFLSEFLSSLDIKLEIDKKCTVLTEYKNVDILVTQESTAIIIENKIYASDQDEQLTRYYDTISEEGFENIHIVYLTLDGSQPSKQSTIGISKSVLDSSAFQCVSYKENIYNWIENCLRLSARVPALRESFAQYLELIENITAQVKSVQYMIQLKKLLTKDDNLANFLDLQQAHNSVVVDLQVDLWTRIQKSLEALLGDPDEKSMASDLEKRDSIHKFMEGRRGSGFFGLFYPIGDGSYQLAVEMQSNGIIAGISCAEEDNPTRHNELVVLLESHSNSQKSKRWPCYKYIEPHIHYRNLTRDDLSTLASEDARQEVAYQTLTYLSSILSVVGERTSR